MVIVGISVVLLGLIFVSEGVPRMRNAETIGPLLVSIFGGWCVVLGVGLIALGIFV